MHSSHQLFYRVSSRTDNSRTVASKMNSIWLIQRASIGLTAQIRIQQLPIGHLTTNSSNESSAARAAATANANVAGKNQLICIIESQCLTTGPMVAATNAVESLKNAKNGNTAPSDTSSASPLANMTNNKKTKLDPTSMTEVTHMPINRVLVGLVAFLCGYRFSLQNASITRYAAKNLIKPH